MRIEVGYQKSEVREPRSDDVKIKPAKDLRVYRKAYALSYGSDAG